MPAQAGIQSLTKSFSPRNWTPAFAGVTARAIPAEAVVMPAQAGIQSWPRAFPLGTGPPLSRG